MKRISITLALALVALVSCQKEENMSAKKGMELTLSATVAEDAAATKTSYEYTSSTVGMAGSIATSWEATEKITVISIGDSGITAVDEFTSTGEAGRVKADFTGTWNGSEGDKVICLYPSVTEATALYDGVSVGSTSITLNSTASAYDLTKDVNTDVNSLKKADVMVGDVSINGTSASVNLNRQISVFKVTVSAPDIDPYYSTYEYVKRISLCAMNPLGAEAVFATEGSLSVTKSSYTGSFTPSAYGSVTFGCNIISDSDSYTYFFPVLAKDELDKGYRITVTGYSTAKVPGESGRPDYGTYAPSVSIGEKLHIYPGYVYELTGIKF